MQNRRPEKLIVPIEWIASGKAQLPQYQTEGSAGMDLKAAIEEEQVLKVGARVLLPTGIRLQIPKGFEAQIRPRSGLAYKHGVTVLNSPGTIDSDYRGEIKILLINLSQEDFTIKVGMRIAQMVFAPVYQAKLDLQLELQESKRSDGGFGSTGTH